ncbi:MAG TPA: M23 family metallopeptidase, partial [Myxococcales bacterium]|nr:M23 family metallopeptidase [Myxococcales bacterium]
ATHQGVDVAAREGTPILSAAGGVVRSVGARGGYGLAVEIDHGHGLTTLYAHTGGALVKPGERIAPGQPIATVGQSGRATGPHLHFEVRRGGRPVDPGQALKAYARRADEDGEVVP